MCKANPYPWHGPEGAASGAAGQQESAVSSEGEGRSRTQDGATRDRYKEPKRRTSVTSRLTRLGRCTTRRASAVPLERGADKPLGIYVESELCDGGQVKAEMGGVRQQWNDGAKLEALTLQASVRPDGSAGRATMIAGNTGRDSVAGVEGEVFRAGGAVTCDKDGLS